LNPTPILPRLYSELAHWWPLFSPASHYVEEAAELLALIDRIAPAPIASALELGSGGGSLAFHLKARFALTLSDLSPQMLAQSRAINPECEHIEGDMRTLRLGRSFDAVLVHDAVMYMTARVELDAALATAAAHCRPGGLLVLMPDCVRETFAPTTGHGGEDGADGRGLRYLEWSWDPDPHDETFEVAYALLLREADGRVRCELDRHREGLFARATWLEAIAAAGFERGAAFMDSSGRDIFTAVRSTAAR
jgi:SAM-dependent methyltransferase